MDLKDKGIKWVNSNGLVAARKKKSGVEYAMQEAHFQLFEGLEVPLS